MKLLHYVQIENLKRYGDTTNPPCQIRRLQDNAPPTMMKMLKINHLQPRLQPMAGGSRVPQENFRNFVPAPVFVPPLVVKSLRNFIPDPAGPA